MKEEIHQRTKPLFMKDYMMTEKCNNREFQMQWKQQLCPQNQ